MFMVSQVITVKDFKEASEVFNRLAESTQRRIRGKVIRRAGRFVFRSARLRARVGSGRWATTGDLSRAIKLTHRRGESMVWVDESKLNRPYHYYQEVGYRPHIIRGWMLKEDVLTRARYSEWIRIRVSKHTPYMKPAYDKMLTKLDLWIKLALRGVRL